MQVIVSLKLVMAFLGSFYSLLESIWFQTRPQNGPQKLSKKCPKSAPRNDPKNNQKTCKFWALKMDPKMGQDGDTGAQAQPSGRCLGSSWLQDAPKMPQDGLK